MKVTIDRFEGKYVVCEKDDRQIIDIERSKIPPEAREGDILEIVDGVVVIDRLETEKRRREIE